MSTAYNGVDALRLADYMLLSLIVRDMEMLKLSGLEVARTLRNKLNMTPILMLSGAFDVP